MSDWPYITTLENRRNRWATKFLEVRNGQIWLVVVFYVIWTKMLVSISTLKNLAMHISFQV